jgi:hypothetical protein
MSGPFNTRTLAILRALCDFAVSLSGLLSNADIPEINRPARTVCRPPPQAFARVPDAYRRPSSASVNPIKETRPSHKSSFLHDAPAVSSGQS